jgi:hypothetical protein
MHFAFGGVGFIAVIVTCFVFARRFSSLREWAIYSAVPGIVFLTAFAASRQAQARPGSSLVF